MYLDYEVTLLRCFKLTGEQEEEGAFWAGTYGSYHKHLNNNQVNLLNSI